jgi:glycosyltransferase involved in cell wall biosynthesis
VKVGIIAYAWERSSPPSFVSYTLKLVEAMSRSGGDLEITLLATSKEGAWHAPSQFRTRVLPGCKWLPGLLSLGNLAAAQAARACELDIVHDPNGFSPFLLRTRSTRWEATVTIHDLVSYVYPETHTAFTNFYQRVWLPIGLRHATAVVAVSQNSKEDVCRYLSFDPQKIVVIPCGVDSRFSPLSEDGERDRLAERYGVRGPYVLYLGDIQPRKNLTTLLLAFGQLRKSLPEHTLVVAGAPAWKDQAIYNMVTKLALDEDVLFTGYVADADVPALYRQASLFAFPSIYEGFGRPPLEAMACGTPVVTSNTSSLPEVVGDAAVLVDPLDISELAGAMERVLTDTGLQRSLIEKGLARAKQFTWERTARETINLYHQLLGASEGSTALS